VQRKQNEAKKSNYYYTNFKAISRQTGRIAKILMAKLLETIHELVDGISKVYNSP